eukprot:TRINITY_DN7052_c0_g1_i1.p1 TRINITY_DN7052_c0_g1~~TRINITY_DN7052_c0_g1_i1.p1  ORF type:complete len:165 (+),score=24.59 TRINITY_DN7052_c0_g1_i1:583-1077(+)
MHSSKRFDELLQRFKHIKADSECRQQQCDQLRLQLRVKSQELEELEGKLQRLERQHSDALDAARHAGRSRALVSAASRSLQSQLRRARSEHQHCLDRHRQATASFDALSIHVARARSAREQLQQDAQQLTDRLHQVNYERLAFQRACERNLSKAQQLSDQLCVV